MFCAAEKWLKSWYSSPNYKYVQLLLWLCPYLKCVRISGSGWGSKVCVRSIEVKRTGRLVGGVKIWNLCILKLERTCLRDSRFSLSLTSRIKTKIDQLKETIRSLYVYAASTQNISISCRLQNMLIPSWMIWYRSTRPTGRSYYVCCLQAGFLAVILDLSTWMCIGP